MRATVGPIVACSLALATSSATATTTCQLTPQGPFCTSQVDFLQFSQQAYMSQLQSEWCWAASISMMYSFYHHPVAQARIVTDVYGAPENIPAMAGITIANELNRCWVDDAGAAFESQVTGVFDAMAGVYGLTNQMIIGELDKNHPMVIGARTHAMVLTMIQYYQTPAGTTWSPQVCSTRGRESARAILMMDELVPANIGGSLLFAATVRITDQTGPCPLAQQPQQPQLQPSQRMCSVAGDLGDAAPTLALVGLAALIAMRRRR
jgi:MYXO-CTERM domain-containing protein